MEKKGESLAQHSKRRKLNVNICLDEIKENSSTMVKVEEKDKQVNDCYCLHLFCDLNIGQGNHKPAVIFDNGKGVEEILSYELLNSLSEFVKELVEKLCEGSDFIGVKCSLGRLYPVLIIGILRSTKAFYNISDEKWTDSAVDGIKHLNLRYILCEPEWVPNVNDGRFILDKMLEQNLPKSDLRFGVYKIINRMDDTGSQPCNAQQHGLAMAEIAYAIQTSGTTGQRKTVLVPHSCICPNIRDFIENSWRVTSEDVIFGSAPPTFDPHIVELFAALGAGATILYTTSDVKLNGSLFTRLILYHRVSILQITPSVFRRLSHSLVTQQGISFLRLLAFGGEACLSKEELKEMLKSIHRHNNIQLQNVYGVTEVSCWASVCNIDLNSNEPATIGKGILDTALSLELHDSEHGEIVITSPTRFCLIIDSSSTITSAQKSDLYKYRTGDLGRLTETGIIFEGRADRVIKRNGMKISLYSIEQMALSTGLVSFAECKLDQGKLYLLVRLKSEYEYFRNSSLNMSNDSNLATLLPALSTKFDLPLFMYPDVIIAVKDIPLNANGKLDFSCIITSLLADNNKMQSFPVTQSQLINTLEPVWRSCTWPGIRNIDTLLNECFLEVGGNSISAARFTESAFLALKLFGSETHQCYEQKLLQTLMKESFLSVVNLLFQITSEVNPIKTNLRSVDFKLLPETQDHLSYPVFHRGTIYEFEHEYIDSPTHMEDSSDIFSEVLEKSGNSSEILFPLNVISMNEFTLGLCVDASPVVIENGVFKTRAIIGCHGGVIICIDLSVLRRRPEYSNLAIAWKRRLPNRIEAPVVICETGLYAYVGCHDSKFYKVSVSNGAIMSFISVGAPIRSQAALSIEQSCIVFIDSENCVYCVSSLNFNLLWIEKSFKLLATVTPIVVRNMVHITTLDKGPIAFDIYNGKQLWVCPDARNIYSSPTLGHIRTTKRRQLVILYSTADGIEARHPKTGSLIWKFKDGQCSALRQSVHQPIYNFCCDNILSISYSDFNVRKIDVHTGNCLKHFKLDNFPGPIAPSIIYCVNINDIKECVLFSKVEDKPNLRYMNLHSGDVFTLKPWFMTNFKTFSKPVSYKEFILFGGRDNKLHVLKCKSYTTNVIKGKPLN